MKTSRIIICKCSESCRIFKVDFARQCIDLFWIQAGTRVFFLFVSPWCLCGIGPIRFESGDQRSEKVACLDLVNGFLEVIVLWPFV